MKLYMFKWCGSCCKLRMNIKYFIKINKKVSIIKQYSYVKQYSFVMGHQIIIFALALTEQIKIFHI